MSLSSSGLAGLSREIAAVAEIAAPAAVRIHAERRAFSGFALQDGVVVTASEPLEGLSLGETVTVETAAGRVEARLTGHDPGTDVAVFQVAGVTALQTPASGAARLGEAVVVVGRELYGPSCAFGIVSVSGDAWESMRGGRIDQRIEIDARLSRGLEGASVLDGEGRLVGMAVFGRRRRILVIPTATLTRAAAELVQHGHRRRGYLGIGVQPVCVASGSEDRIGLMVVGLDRKGPAAAAGVLQGDILVALSDAPLKSARHLHRQLTAETIGTTVGLSLIRAGGLHRIDAEVGEAER